MPVRSGFRLVARVASANHAGTYEVCTDGAQLTCECPGWTRRTHYPTCPAFRGGTCSCTAHLLDRPPGAAPKDARTCRHVRHVDALIGPLGGLREVNRRLASGAWSVTGENRVEGSDPLKDAVDAFCRAHLIRGAIAAGVEALVRRFAGAVHEPASVSVPDWLGGARAIILRD